MVPDLAVEVISEGNTEAEMERKLEEYFTAGVRLVWYLYPTERTVHVYTTPTDVRALHEEEALDGGTAKLQENRTQGNPVPLVGCSALSGALPEPLSLGAEQPVHHRILGLALDQVLLS
jgi:Putative restriction endonuclease